MTYVVLSAVVLALLLAVTWPTLRTLRRAPLAIAAVVLVVLTVVFDNVIVAMGLVDYDESKILGLRMPVAPVEDLAYAVGAVLLVPAVWTLLSRRRGGGE